MGAKLLLYVSPKVGVERGSRASLRARPSARLRVVVGADHLLGIAGHRDVAAGGRRRLRRARRAALLLLLAAMARHPALASGFTRFLGRPLVRRAFLMRGLAA